MDEPHEPDYRRKDYQLVTEQARRISACRYAADPDYSLAVMTPIEQPWLPVGLNFGTGSSQLSPARGARAT
jgi:hypothetical protein